MSKALTLRDRMKQYETVTKNWLTLRTPKVIRLDMKGGAGFCKGFEQPFDDLFSRCMMKTAQDLCQQIPGVVFAYTQSDKISLVLNDVSDTTSRMITSAYNNVVPAAKSDIIEMKIKLNGEDVTYKQFADTVEIPYNDLEKYKVLENTELILNFKGKDYTAKEFEELGMNLGEPQARFFAETDFSESIAARLGHDMEDSYFENTSDDDEPVAYVNLSEINPEGVFQGVCRAALLPRPWLLLHHRACEGDPCHDQRGG